MTSRAQKIIIAWLKLQEKKAEGKKVLEWIQDKTEYVKNQSVESDSLTPREKEYIKQINALESKLRGILTAKSAAEGNKGKTMDDLFGGLFK